MEEMDLTSSTHRVSNIEDERGECRAGSRGCKTNARTNYSRDAYQ